MEVSKATVDPATSQQVTPAATASTTAPSAEFDTLMHTLLPGANSDEVSEEDLFAALVQERISVLGGSEAATKYQEALAANKATLKKPDGFIPMEECANRAVEKLVADGTLTADVADQVQTQAFAAAQLDNNKSLLWDNRGGTNDPSVATATLEAALLSARAVIETGTSSTGASATTSGETGDTTGGSVTPTGQSIDGTEGFLFKPQSDTTHNLVVLLPSSMVDQIQSVALLDKDGNQIEQGTLGGVGNGGRENYRFSKPGASYDKNISVQVTLANGEIKKYDIPDPSLRYD